MNVECGPEEKHITKLGERLHLFAAILHPVGLGAPIELALAPPDVVGSVRTLIVNPITVGQITSHFEFQGQSQQEVIKLGLGSLHCVAVATGPSG